LNLRVFRGHLDPGNQVGPQVNPYRLTAFINDIEAGGKAWDGRYGVAIKHLGLIGEAYPGLLRGHGSGGKDYECQTLDD